MPSASLLELPDISGTYRFGEPSRAAGSAPIPKARLTAVAATDRGIDEFTEYRPDITSWSVTVGMSNTLTVNIASKHVKSSPDLGVGLDGPSYYV